MKNTILLIGIAATIISCGSNEEKQGIAYAQDIYGATIEKTEAPADAIEADVAATYFLKASQSAIIDSLQPTVTTANIARLAWAGMSQEEKTTYSKVDVEVMKLDNKTTSSYTYPTSLLDILNHKAINFTKFSQALVDEDFGDLDALKDENEIKLNLKIDLGAVIDMNQRVYGDLIGYKPFGISELKDANGFAYQYQGYLVYENGKHQPYFVIIDGKEGLDKIIQFRVTN